LPAMAAVRDVNIPLDIYGWIRHRVQVLRDLHAKMKRERLARRSRSFHADDVSRGAFGHARNQVVLRGNEQARFSFAETHERPRIGPGDEARAVYRHVSAGDACTRQDTVNARDAVRVQIQFSNSTT